MLFIYFESIFTLLPKTENPHCHRIQQENIPRFEGKSFQKNNDSLAADSLQAWTMKMNEHRI